MSSQSSLVLLSRVLSLKDGGPFILISDTLVQSGVHVLQEIINNVTNDIIYVSFETVNKPSYVTTFIDAMDKSSSQIINEVKQFLDKKCLVIIDSVNYTPVEELSRFIPSLVGPGSTVVGIYHGDLVNRLEKIVNYPSSTTILQYMASCILEVEPIYEQELEELITNEVNKLKIPINPNINSHQFKLILTNRRKSGRSLTYEYIMNTETHDHQIYKEQNDDQQDDEGVLEDLTTFNLNTSSKQKAAKEQVELPFMQSQEQLGAYSGAIVYEFEKDDDYDEEDAYEDPF